MSSYDEITKLVSIIISMRELFNHHGDHTAEYSAGFANALALQKEDVELITVGAKLHDIGKIFIRPELLNFPRRLTEWERKEMEAHVEVGWEVVNRAGYDIYIQQIVRHHHERWDGKGYPDGLKGNEIPMGSQIVGICDVYAALTSARSYREAFSHNYAMAAIQKDKGIRFNPELVDVFFEKVTFRL